MINARQVTFVLLFAACGNGATQGRFERFGDLQPGEVVGVYGYKNTSSELVALLVEMPPRVSGPGDFGGAAVDANVVLTGTIDSIDLVGLRFVLSSATNGAPVHVVVDRQTQYGVPGRVVGGDGDAPGN